MDEKTQSFKYALEAEDGRRERTIVQEVYGWIASNEKASDVDRRMLKGAKNAKHCKKTWTKKESAKYKNKDKTLIEISFKCMSSHYFTYSHCQKGCSRPKYIVIYKYQSCDLQYDVISFYYL